ncbi:MAG: T9SS type A sorting domain-containing protein [Bacteroidales bacterium]|nr:T9SS type A sorting domain-containing protein [Bacteroidales bacterium]
MKKILFITLSVVMMALNAGAQETFEKIIHNDIWYMDGMSSLNGKQAIEPRWTDIVTAQPSGYAVDANGDVEISSAEGLAWLISVVNGLNGCEPYDFDGRIVRLTADIDLEEDGLRLFSPIGSSEHRFMGTFDGNGHSIDGLCMIFNEYYVDNEDEMRIDMGLFGYLYHGTVKNLSLNSGFYSYGHPFNHTTGTCELYYDALVAAVADSLSTVENCYCRFRVSELVGNAHPAGTYMGAVVGLNRNSTVRNCAYEMDEYSQCAALDVAGLVLRNLSEGGYADAVVENCYFYGALMGSYSAENMGGIVCFNETASDNRGKKAMVRNCYSELLGPLYGFRDKGCIVAYNSEGSLVENCFADLRGQYSSTGLFGTDNGETARCMDFVPSGNGGMLSSPITCDEMTSIDLCKVLNYWIYDKGGEDMYHPWTCGQYYIPEFDFSIASSHENEAVPVLVYPNPAANSLKINVSGSAEIESVSLYDISGRLVKAQQSGFGSIDISGLATGMYVMKVTLDDGKVFEEKIVKK